MLYLFFVAAGCNNNNGSPAEHPPEVVVETYTCSMHPQVIRDKPGKCPVCGMQLIKKEKDGKRQEVAALEALLKPTNEFVVSAIPVTAIQKKQEDVAIEALGTITYDTRQVRSISSKVSGRIEKLYVRYRYQKISKGQHILDMYSPELITAQQNLLFLLKNDPANTSFIQAAEEKLLLLGLSVQQLQQIIQSRKALLSVAVYSNYSGHIHESVNNTAMRTATGNMTDISVLTEELALKEGMYLQKGQPVFIVYNPDRAWVILNIYAENQGLVKKGNSVQIFPETTPGKSFPATIDFIEPFYQKDNKTLTVRVYFNNSHLKIPIGSQVRAIISGNTNDAYWLPEDAVMSLGVDKIVFIKTAGGFATRKVNTGTVHKNHIQVLSGVDETDSVAANARYLMDSESFIKVKN